MTSTETSETGSTFRRKPDWIRAKAPVSDDYHDSRKLMRRLNLHSVCEDAA